MMAHIGYADRKAILDEALDICTITERRVVVTTMKEDASTKEFTDYLLETIDRLKEKNKKPIARGLHVPGGSGAGSVSGRLFRIFIFREERQ